MSTNQVKVGWRAFSSPVSGTDTDAQAFITAAAITDSTQQSAINTLVTQLKSYGIWTKLKAVYPFVGGSATSHKFNLKDPRDLDAAYRLVFNGGWVHSSTGVLPNGTTAYADTKLKPFGVFNNTTYAHMSYYSRTSSGFNNSEYGMGSNDGVNNLSFVFRRANNLQAFVADFSNATYRMSLNSTSTDGSGLFVGTQQGTDIKLFKQNTLQVSNTVLVTGGVPPNYNVFIGALNSLNVSESYTNKESAFASIGDGLTDAEAANFYTAVQTFQSTLGRQVGTPVLAAGQVAGLLDTYTGASAAYSLRKLRTAYSGYAIRVRRSSDNTTLDVGFDANGNLDTASMLSFVGAGNGFVSIWYDQSGNNLNGTQETSSYQPKIVNSGSLVTDGGKPSVLFNNVNTSINFALNRGVFTGFDSYFVQNSNSDAFYISPVFPNGNGYCAQQGSSTTELFLNYTVPGNPSSTQLYTNNVLQNVTNRGQVYTALNGRKLVLHSNMDIINSQSNSNKTITYGAYNYTGLADFGGYLSEYIIFPNTLQSSNRTAISTNINTFYSIY
jgi:hypothetical protein